MDAPPPEGPPDEIRHVRAVYDRVARHFSSTRFSVWPNVARFLAGVEPGSIVADVGCGNGKYLGVLRPSYVNLVEDSHDLRARALGRTAASMTWRDGSAPPPAEVLGSDTCLPLVSLAAARGFEGMVADCARLPYRSGAFDAAISIAVVHHLCSQERRREAVAELVRIVRPGGRALVYVWAAEQPDPRTRKKWVPVPGGDPGDFYVPWHLDRGMGKEAERDAEALYGGEGEKGPWDGAEADAAGVDPRTGETVYRRYYHVFAEGELETLCAQVPSCRVHHVYFDKGNWAAELVRLQEPTSTPRDTLHATPGGVQ